MLVEEGFKVVSVDASDKMLKYALRQRWKRRRNPAFDNWGKQYSVKNFWKFFRIKQALNFCTPFSRTSSNF